MPQSCSEPTTFLQFIRRFATEEACEAWFARWRWPQGPRCPGCDSAAMTRVRTRRLWQCSSCRRQTSVRAGTMLHRSKVPLQVWAYALWRMGTSRVSISALQLQRETGHSYKTVWNLLQRVRAVLAEREGPGLYRGTVEIDESMLGGSKGRAARRLGDGGRWLYAAVERLPVGEDGKDYRASGSARMEVGTDVTTSTIRSFVDRSVRLGASITTDGFPAYRDLQRDGFDHKSVIQGQDKLRRRVVIETHLPKVHLLFSNFKSWITGTFHGVSGKWLEPYVREFIYRFNRRRLGTGLFPYLARRLVRAGPMTRAELAEATT